jgi:16S rRNA C1402 N4-methylase RsmH
MRAPSHIPVLLNEVMDYLDVYRDGIYIDCTLGLG